MIEIIDTKNQRHPNSCRNCGSYNYTKDIKFSIDGTGCTVITLCNDCRIELIGKLHNNILTPISFRCKYWNSNHCTCRLTNETCIKGMDDYECEWLNKMKSGE